MQINSICNIFCIKNLRKAPNHEQLIEQYHECVKPIMNATTQPSELKQLTKTYGRPLIQLCNNLQKELSLNTKQISQNLIKIRHTLLQIALLTDQCLIKLKTALKMKQWSIEKMWNMFLCRAVSYRFWDLLNIECDIFLNYLNSLNADIFSSSDLLSEYINLFASNLYNKSRALIEINFNKYYKQSTELLQKSIQSCNKHKNIQWKITFLDQVFRVINKIITDFCNGNNSNKNEEFALCLQGLYCLLIKNKYVKEFAKENNEIMVVNNQITFWDITNQYIRFVKSRYDNIGLIEFRKSIIEIYMQYENMDWDKIYDIKFINLCIDYMLSIGECDEKLKIDILLKIVGQLDIYIEHLNEKLEFKMIINIVKSIVLTQMGMKYEMEYIKNSIKSFDNLYLLLKENNYLFIKCMNNDIWKLLSKSMRNIPYLILDIEDRYSFNSNQNDLNIINLYKIIVLNILQLFNIWHKCNNKIISTEKLKNANHRLLDTLIKILMIESKYFLYCLNNKVMDDIIHLLQACDNHIPDPYLFKTLSTKAFNVAVQIYNKHKFYDKILLIIEIISGWCIRCNDTSTLSKCDTLYESALFKCNNIQLICSKLGQQIAKCIDMANKLNSNDITMSYKYLKLLVKYQTKFIYSNTNHKQNNNTSISIIDMLENIGIGFNNINENIIINLLKEQLRLYQSQFTYNTINQQIEILEILLTNYFFNQKPIQRAIALIDLAKLIRIHNPTPPSKICTPKKTNHNNILTEDDFEMDDKNPLDLLEEAIDLLNEVKISGIDDDEMDYKIIMDDILASAYVWISIIKRELYATNQAVESEISSLNSSMIQLDLEVNNVNDDAKEDDIGFMAMMQATDIYSGLITKYCKSKCKHELNETESECNQCHKCFRNLFITMQHLQIIMDYMHLNNYIAFEIFVLDRMIRLLSTMSNGLMWCREYRLLCLCWLGIAYYKFGNINQSEKIFMELEPILLKTTPNISSYIKYHIQIIYAKYIYLTNKNKNQKENGMNKLLQLKKLFDKNKNKWEDVYLMCKLKIILAQIQIESPKVFQNNINTEINAEILAKDALIGYIRLIDKLHQQFMFVNDSNKTDNNSKNMSAYNQFIHSLPNKKYQFYGVSNKQFISQHHTQSPIHNNHTPMLFHYPSEFRLISDFIQCILILGKCFDILHEPKVSLYHFKNGQKATYNLIIKRQQKLFLMHLAKIENKQKNFDKCNEYLNEYKNILNDNIISNKLTEKIYNSLSKITPYACNYDKYILDILYIEIEGDQLRYKNEYKKAINKYDECLTIIQSFNITNTNDFIPILRLKYSIKRKYALCLLYTKEPKSLEKCFKFCVETLNQHLILNDLIIAKIKLYIGQCLILMLKDEEILKIIWKGNSETEELELILDKNKFFLYKNENKEVDLQLDTNTKYFNKSLTFSLNIEWIICARQNLIQSLLILLNLKLINPELVKQASFALAYIYGYCNIKLCAMFLNISQSVNIRLDAIKQYKKQIFEIKKQWHIFKNECKKNNYNYNINKNCRNNNIGIEEFVKSVKKIKKNNKFDVNNYLTNEEYNILYTRFYHKLTAIQYYDSNDNNNVFDYNNFELCLKIINIICNKFYNNTINWLQYSWNCLSIEVDCKLFDIILISLINPKSKSHNRPNNEITMVNIPINNNNTNHKKEEEIKDEEPNNYNEIVNEFNVFLIELHDSTISGKECNGQNEIKIWWDKRYKLDNKLKAFLKKFECKILSIFKCLFIPSFRYEKSKKLLYSFTNVLTNAINEYLIKKLNNNYLLTCVNRSPKMILFEKLLQLMLICYDKTNEDFIVSDFEIKYGLEYIFNISDKYLLNKLFDTIQSHIITIYNKFILSKNNKNNTNINLSAFDPLLITIGDTLNHLPWENIPILKYCHQTSSICRIPCLEFATLRVMQYKDYIFKNNYYFVINPKNDLKKTEKRFERLLNNNWNGIKSKEPTFEQFRFGLEKNNVFLYIGHNAGEEFVNCQKLKGFEIKSITFLMGSSSGLLKKKGNYLSNEIANYYMIASAPIVIANLWDVTDKDIDEFTTYLLKKSILHKDDNNKNGGICDIATAVNISRNVCKLPYINGAAPICYGIPFHLKSGIFV